MKKYFFGDNGIITKQIPQLRNEYKKEKNRILFVGRKSDLMQNFSENYIFIKKNNKSSKVIKKISNRTSSIFDELSNPIHRRNNHRYNSSIQNKRGSKLNLTKTSKHRLLYSSYSLKKIGLKTQRTFDIYSPRKANTSLSLINTKQEIKSKLTSFNKTHIKLEKRLFSILDKAEVKNKAVTYLKSNREKDIEDITGKSVKKYKKPIQIRSHYYQTIKLNELVKKDCKDIISSEQVISHNTSSPKTIKIKSFQFDKKSRTKAETNFINIRKLSKNISKEYENFFSKCNNYSIK